MNSPLFYSCSQYKCYLRISFSNHTKYTDLEGGKIGWPIENPE